MNITIHHLETIENFLNPILGEEIFYFYKKSDIMFNSKSVPCFCSLSNNGLLELYKNLELQACELGELVKLITNMGIKLKLCP
ncbi:MAG: hypothetical protein ABH887_01730 [bacterium]